MSDVAVAIASDLSKDMSGTPLLRGVSFKLERRDRLTIAGRNGAGKTTLLRMLSGETSIDGGELVFQKGVRIALHDQRPPRASERSLAQYVGEGLADLRGLESRLKALEERMAGGDHEPATLSAKVAMPSANGRRQASMPRSSAESAISAGSKLRT